MVNVDVHRNLNMTTEDVNTDELKPILRSIIITRCKDGATIDETIDDYKELTGESLLSIFRDRDQIADFLRSIDGVWSSFNAPCGPYLWYCNTQKTQHISEMIKKQKSPRMNSNRRPQQQQQHQAMRYLQPRTTYSSVDPSAGATSRDKFFEDNMYFIPKRNAWNRVQQRVAGSHPYLPPQRRQQLQQGKQSLDWRYYSSTPNSGPDFFGYQMIGDDFFLSLARWEMGYSFDPEHNIHQSGLCISGLTIAEAADRVMKATYINDRVIVNVGVVDLLHGHDFIDMQQDLFRLMKNLEIRGASVMLTTLSPLANSSHIPGITDRLHKFNALIRKHHWTYVDLWRCFVNERNNTLYECFQPGPRHVSGSNQPHVLWNKLGRQRVIKFLKSHLSEFL